MAAQLIGTNAPLRARDQRVEQRAAMTSLPVPVSPVSSTGIDVARRAARPARARARAAALSATKPSARRRRRLRRQQLASRAHERVDGASGARSDDRRRRRRRAPPRGARRSATGAATARSTAAGRRRAARVARTRARRPRGRRRRAPRATSSMPRVASARRQRAGGGGPTQRDGRHDRHCNHGHTHECNDVRIERQRESAVRATPAGCRCTWQAGDATQAGSPRKEALMSTASHGRLCIVAGRDRGCCGRRAVRLLARHAGSSGEDESGLVIKRFGRAAAAGPHHRARTARPATRRACCRRAGTSACGAGSTRSSRVPLVVVPPGRDRARRRRGRRADPVRAHARRARSPATTSRTREAFLRDGGESGRQLGFLTAGTYRINPALFDVVTAAQRRRSTA